MAFKLRLVLTGAAIASIYLTSLGSLRAAEVLGAAEPQQLRRKRAEQRRQ